MMLPKEYAFFFLSFFLNKSYELGDAFMETRPVQAYSTME